MYKHLEHRRRDDDLIGIQLDEKVGQVTLDSNQIQAKEELADARRKH